MPTHRWNTGSSLGVLASQVQPKNLIFDRLISKEIEQMMHPESPSTASSSAVCNSAILTLLKPLKLKDGSQYDQRAPSLFFNAYTRERATTQKEQKIQEAASSSTQSIPSDCESSQAFMNKRMAKQARKEVLASERSYN